MTPAPNPAIPEVPPSAPASSFRAQSRNPSPASQRINQKIQRPLHSTMDTATSRSMTALCRVTVCAEADDGVGRATASPSPNTPPLLPPTPPFPKCPQRPNFVIPRAVAESMTPAPHPAIPEVPLAPQLRHSVRSRGIHLREPTHQPEKPAPSALHHGYCDFAQYDGVGIPRAVAESISREPTHQPDNPVPSALHHGYCDFAQYDGVV